MNILSFPRVGTRWLKLYLTESCQWAWLGVETRGLHGSWGSCSFFQFSQEVVLEELRSGLSQLIDELAAHPPMPSSPSGPLCQMAKSHFTKFDKFTNSSMNTFMNIFFLNIFLNINWWICSLLNIPSLTILIMNTFTVNMASNVNIFLWIYSWIYYSYDYTKNVFIAYGSFPIYPNFLWTLVIFCFANILAFFGGFLCKFFK